MKRHRRLGSMNSEAHYATARRIAGEGIVLLKNDGGVLPLDTTKALRVLVVGENAIKMMTVGGGSSSLKVQRETLPLEGMRSLLGDKIRVEYARGYVGDTTGEYNGVVAKQKLYDPRTPDELIAEAVAKAKEADCVVVFGGLNKSDYQDAEGHDRKQYGLPYGQDRLVEVLAEANKNLVFVNISGNPVAMPWLDKVAAVVQGWFWALRRARRWPTCLRDVSTRRASCRTHGGGVLTTCRRISSVRIPEHGAKTRR